MTTFESLNGLTIAVEGATGVSGFDAARIEIILESGLYPIALRAYTLN
ncbi:MAG: hypothetical protein NZ777_18235 [Pseudomonadales bacterium]|nr:hypothetical protein [Pseudomonadales bacterium]